MKKIVVGELPKVRPPSALIADAGDKKAYLEWNPNLETNLLGYHVYRKEGEDFVRITPKPVPSTNYIDQNLINGQIYRYVVCAIDEQGEESPPSNEVDLSPYDVKDPIITEGEVTLRLTGLRPIFVEDALTVTFANGQRIIFDKLRMRVRDWTNEDGVHLIYPQVYGNPIDITQLNNWGYHDPKPPSRHYPATPPPITPDYQDFSVKHHYHRGMADWEGCSIQDGRVTFHYTLPMVTGIVDRHTRLQVWETWYAAERDISGTIYKGLFRKIELQLPSFFQNGYSVCLNEAFGINGSCQGAVTYDLQWDNPYLDEVHWSSAVDTVAHKRYPIRKTLEYRPSLYALQVHPFLFLNFGSGTFLLSARHYYFSTTYLQSNYVDCDQDGIWPNYMVDCAVSGQRFALETFEYLFNSDNRLQPPQLYMDAAMHYRRKLANLYQLNPYLTTFNYGWAFLDSWSREAFQNQNSDYEVMMKSLKTYRHPEPPTYQTPFDLPDSLEELRRYAAIKADDASRLNMDLVGGAIGLWFTTPYAVDPDLRFDENHPINQAIKDYTSEFREKGIGVAYWLRPDFVKTGTANTLSAGFIERYLMYVTLKFPAIMEKLEKEGLKLIRDHPDWLKRGRDGSLPNFEVDFCENWTPVSFASGYYDEVLIPTLKMMHRLGFTTIFQDGLFSVMSGVDYHEGHAIPNMPYLWRWLQDATLIGLDFAGECLLGWGNNTVPTPAEIDAANPWALIHSCFRGDLEASWVGARFRHIANSLYASAYMDMGSTEDQVQVAKFCEEFVQSNGHPDRVFLENLRWDYIDSSGHSALRGWVWDAVFWEYADGRRVKYPSYPEFLANQQQETTQVEGQKTEMDRGTGNILPGKA